MTWESVSSHSAFPTENSGFPPAQQYQQQPPAPTPPPQAQFPPPPGPPGGAPPFGDPSQMFQQQPPAMQAPPAPIPGPTDAGQPFAQNPQVLSKDFDEEFDISEALRGNDDDPNNQDKGGENDKKIKDALRGLFS